MIAVTMKLGRMPSKNFFFDQARVRDTMGAAKRKNLARQGAFIRTAARSSIRRRKRTSEAGKPPSSHAGILKRLLFFSYDRDRDSVVIGPAKTNQVFFQSDGKPVTGTTPEVLEGGGDIFIREVWQYGRWRRPDLRSRRRSAGLPTRLRKVHVEARPFMGPAMEKGLQDLEKVWRDSVKARP